MPHWVILLSSYCSLSTVTDSLGYLPLKLLWPILQTMPNWVILLLSYYSLSTNATSLGHPFSTLFWPILKTLPPWVILLSSYYSLSTNTASQGHPPLTLLEPIYNDCITGSSSSLLIIVYLQSLTHWVIFLSPYYSLSTNTASLGHPPLAIL